MLPPGQRAIPLRAVSAIEKAADDRAPDAVLPLERLRLKGRCLPVAETCICTWGSQLFLPPERFNRSPNNAAVVGVPGAAVKPEAGLQSFGFSMRFFCNPGCNPHIDLFRDYLSLAAFSHVAVVGACDVEVDGAKWLTNARKASNVRRGQAVAAQQEFGRMRCIRHLRCVAVGAYLWRCRLPCFVRNRPCFGASSGSRHAGC